MAKKIIKKIYKTKVVVEVISEEPINFDTLADLHLEITDGQYSGRWDTKKPVILTGKKAVKAIEAQGSDPSFFMMDKNGNEIEI